MKVRFWLFATALLLLTAGLWGQNPRVTGVQPGTAKVGVNITVAGENLGKENVAAVFISNPSDDFPVAVVEQTATKIVVKLPKVKAGDYNISIQVKGDILIQPIRVTIQE